MNIFGLNISRREQVQGVPESTSDKMPLSTGATMPAEVVRVRGRQAALRIPAVMRAITVIANGVASMPIHYQKIDDEHGGNYVDYMRGGGRKINYLLRKQPNPTMTATDFKKRMAVNIICEGNAVAYVHRNYNMEPDAIYLCHEASVDPLTMTYTIGYQTEHGYRGLVEVPREDVLHWKADHVTEDGLMGISLLDYAVDALSLAATNDRRAMLIAGNGGDMKYLVSEDNKNPQVGATRRLTKEQKDTQKDSIQSQLNDGNNVILVSGMIDVKPITDPGSTQVLLDTRKYDTIRIAQIFGVPPISLMDYTNNTYKAPEQAMHELHRTLMPYKYAIENELDAKFIGEVGFDRLRFWMDDEVFMAIDPKTRAEMLKMYIEMGVYCPNEARHAMNLPALKKEEGGDQHLVSTNLQKLDDIKLGKNQVESKVESQKSKDGKEDE